MRRSLITIALAIGLLAGGASTAFAAPSARAPKLPVLYNLGGAPFTAWNLPQIRPGVFFIFADGSAALIGAPGRKKDKPIRWKSWTRRSAFARGYYTWRDKPAPGPYHYSAITISLWDARTHGGIRPGVRYYDKMTLHFTRCHSQCRAVLKYRTFGSGKYRAGTWLVIRGGYP
jgi:hypothetical protein